MADFVYVMAYAEKLHKIGFSNDPYRRLPEIQALDGTGISIVRTWARPRGDAQDVETQAHTLLGSSRALNVRSDEIFEIGEYAACLAVELAQALVDDRPVKVGRNIPLSASKASAHLSGIVERRSWLGFLPPFGAYEKDGQVAAMRAQGVSLERIYSDRLALMKALRHGDTLLVEWGAITDWSDVRGKGVVVREV